MLITLRNFLTYFYIFILLYNLLFTDEKRFGKINQKFFKNRLTTQNTVIKWSALIDDTDDVSHTI